MISTYTRAILHTISVICFLIAAISSLFAEFNNIFTLVFIILALTQTTFMNTSWKKYREEKNIHQ